MQINHQFLLLTIIVLAVLIVGLLCIIWSVSLLKDRASHNQQIYIGNLPYRVNDRELYARFSTYGNIVELRIVKDRRTGRSKGYAFMTFSAALEAKRSLVEHGQELGSRSLVVHIAKPR